MTSQQTISNLVQVPGAVEGTMVDPNYNGIFGLAIPNIPISREGLRFQEICKSSTMNFGVQVYGLFHSNQESKQQVTVEKATNNPFGGLLFGMK